MVEYDYHQDLDQWQDWPRIWFDMDDEDKEFWSKVIEKKNFCNK